MVLGSSCALGWLGFVSSDPLVHLAEALKSISINFGFLSGLAAAVLGGLWNDGRLSIKTFMKWPRVEKAKMEWIDLQLRSLFLSFFLAFLLGPLALLFDDYIVLIHVVVKVLPIKQELAGNQAGTYLLNKTCLNLLIRRSCSAYPFWLHRLFLLRLS